MRSVFCVASWCLITLALPAGARADDVATALLAKHYAYVGWQYGDGRVPTLKLTGHVIRMRKNADPVQTAHTVESISGIIYRRTTVSNGSGVSSDVGFTGKVFWSSNENGFTVPERGDGIRARIARQVAFYEATTTLSGTVMKNDLIDGSPVTVIRETPPHSYPLDLYVDPQTGAYRRIVIDPQGSDYAIEIDRYADFGSGKKTIGAWHFHGSSYRNVIDTIEAGAAISASDLHPPSPSARWTFGSGSAIPLEIRPALLRSGTALADELRVYVTAKVNGVEGRFIIDTGSSAIALTDSFAKRAKTTKIDRSAARGIAGSIATLVQRADSIAFADGSTLENVVVVSGIDEGNERCDGLLGYDLFGGAVVTLDFGASTLHVSDPETTPGETGAYVFMPDLSDGTPVMPVVLGNSIKSFVLLDSGNPTFALLATDYISRLRVLINRSSLASTQTIGGVSGGTETDQCGPVSSIALGPIAYQGVFACFSPSADDREGIVGLDFLKHFTITFDYPHGKLLLVPRK